MSDVQKLGRPQTGAHAEDLSHQEPGKKQTLFVPALDLIEVLEPAYPRIHEFLIYPVKRFSHLWYILLQVSHNCVGITHYGLGRFPV